MKNDKGVLYKGWTCSHSLGDHSFQYDDFYQCVKKKSCKVMMMGMCHRMQFMRNSESRISVACDDSENEPLLHPIFFFLSLFTTTPSTTTTMELHVPAKAIPYNVLAVIASTNKLKETVKLIPSRDVTEATLKVNAAATLTGAASIARFFIRYAQLLDEQRPESQKEARLVDLLVSSPEAALQLVKEPRQTKYLLSNEPGLVDFLAWGALHGESSPDASYAAQLQVVKDALLLSEECQAAAAPASVDTIPSIEGSAPETNPMDVFKNLIASQLNQISGVDAKLIYESLDLPRSLEHGDLAVAVPRLRVKGNPAQFAQQWAAAFRPNDHITAAVAIGPFLNFRINPAVMLKRTLALVADMKTEYGSNKLGNGKRIIVEFSSPNIAKPFHAGHLRSTIIGAFIYNVYKANGWDAISMNYLGDWGKQYGK